MKNDKPAGKESTGNERDAQTEPVNLDSIETTDVEGEVMVPLNQVKELVQKELSQFIEVRSDDENPAVEDIWIAGQPFGKIINGNRETAKSAEEQARAAVSSDSEPTGNDAETASHDDLLPIERLIRGEQRDDWHVGKATESVERAKELFRHFEEWSSKTPKGRVIKTSGKGRGTSTLKNLLNAVLDGPDLAWKQIYRCCYKLEEWTRGAIQFVEPGRHGKMLVMDPDFRSSSVANG